MKRTPCAFLALIPLPAISAPVWVGDFSSPDATIPAPWRIERPNPQVPATRYRARLWDGVPAVEAHAVRSMALLTRPVAIDLTRTPILCWRWRIDAPLKNADMTQKSGDDYAARVYLSFEVAPDRLGIGTRMGLGLARSIHGDQVPDAAINYIWDNRHAIGTWQPNAYTERARMLVLRSGSGEAGRWVEERRNVSADFQTAFGHAPLKLTGIAIASDTDNTGEEARAGIAPESGSVLLLDLAAEAIAPYRAAEAIRMVGALPWQPRVLAIAGTDRNVWANETAWAKSLTGHIMLPRPANSVAAFLAALLAAMSPIAGIT